MGLARTAVVSDNCQYWHGGPAQGDGGKRCAVFKDVTVKFGQLFIDLAAVDKDHFYE